MFEVGLVTEIRKLKDLDLSLTASRLIGVRETLAYINGELSLEAAMDKMKQNTRNYAKRQLTWFRNKQYEFVKPDLETITARINQEIL